MAFFLLSFIHNHGMISKEIQVNTLNTNWKISTFRLCFDFESRAGHSKSNWNSVQIMAVMMSDLEILARLSKMKSILQKNLFSSYSFFRFSVSAGDSNRRWLLFYSTSFCFCFFCVHRNKKRKSSTLSMFSRQYSTFLHIFYDRRLGFFYSADYFK